MGLNGKGDLSAAEIAFFAPALCIATYILFRHGFNKQLGWFYLVMLSILRIVGASATLYMETQNKYTPGLLETAAITSSVGTAPLVLALLGFLHRISDGMTHPESRINNFVFRGIHLLALGGLVIAIIGGVDETNTNANTAKTGRELVEAASILFLTVFLCAAGITVLFMSRKSSVHYTETKLLYAGAIALPFLCVRILYTVIVAFSSHDPSSNFYYRNVNVLVSAFMQFLMEAIVVMIFIAAGLLTPGKQTHHQSMNAGVQAGRKDYSTRDPEQGRGASPEAHLMEERQQQRQERPHPQQQQRNIGDYRPSRLIMNAIGNRR